MTASAHHTTIELLGDLPADAPAGTSFLAVLTIACAEGCSLTGGVVRAEGGEAVRSETLTSCPEQPEGVHVVRLHLPTPDTVGRSSWQVVFPDQVLDGLPHAGCAEGIEIDVVPHTTSMAVWGASSPLPGGRFTVEVGARCSLGCELAGRAVEVFDDSGHKVGDGRLGTEPRAGTEALYCTSVDLPAPARPGLARYTVCFAPDDMEVSHDHAVADFSVRCLDRPEFVLTVHVRFRGDLGEAPLADMDVRVGPYRARTDHEGVARLGVSAGEHELTVWRTDVEEPVRVRVDVAGDCVEKVEVSLKRPVDEDEERLWA